MTPEALADYFREKLGEKVTDTRIAYGQLTVTVEPSSLPDVARLCKDDPQLDFAFFDFMSGVDLAEEGFAVITHLYSVAHRHHVSLRAVAPGGREAPKLPSISGIYRGANWHEREAYDMFGVEFDGHPGLLPRILTVENFEGFPLRKEFLLTTREAKPWPGLKEPAEEPADDSGAAQPVESGMSAEDKAQAAKDKAERAKRKAAEMRAKKARERAAAEGAPAAEAEPSAEAGAQPDAATEAQRTEALQADTDAPQEPTEVADAAETASAKDAAAGTVGGDTASGATQDEPGVEEPVPNPEAEELTAEGGEPEPGGSPGVTEHGRVDSEEPAPEPGGTPAHDESPRHDEPQGTQAPVEPAHSPAADLAPGPREELTEEEGDEPPPAPGTDASERADTATAADREDGDKES